MEKAWEEIQKKTNTVFFNLSQRGAVLSLTDNFYHLTGLDPQSVYGKHVQRFLPKDFQSTWNSASSRTQPYEFFANLNVNGSKSISALINLVEQETKGYSGSATIIKNQLQNQEGAFNQQEILRSTLQSIDDLVFVVDSNGVFTECYPGNDSSVFFSSDLFVGKTFEEMGFPQDVSRKFYASIKNVQSTGKTQQLQYSLKVFGSEFFYQAKLSPRYNNKGEFEGTTAICRDITSLKKIEGQLIDSRDFYLSILQRFPTLVWRAGKNGECDFFNDTWLEFTGRSLETQLGFGWVKCVHPNDRPAVVDTFKKAIRKRLVFQSEYRLLHNSGKYRWVKDIGQPVYSIQNEFIGYIGSCTDVHQEKINRRLLIESEERYRNIVELHSDLLIRWLPDSTLTFVNKPFCRLLQKNAEQLLGKKFIDFIPGDGKRKLNNFLEKIGQDLSTQILEQQIIGPNEQSHWIQWVSSPIFDSAGAFIEFQSVGRDITSHIKEEKEKERLLDSLNRRVKELTFLNEFSSVIHHNENSFEMVLKYLVEDMPQVFIKSARTYIKITYGNQVYIGSDFRETETCLKETFGKSTQELGTIELFCEFSQKDKNSYISLLGEMRSYLAIIRDVLETFVNKYVAEVQLKTTEQKYLELFESITDIVFVMDQNWHFSSINPAFKNILGYENASELFFKNIVAPSSLPSIYKAFDGAVKQGNNTVVFEADVLNSMGEIKNFLINCLIKYEAGEWSEILGVARDVTESRQMSRKILKAIVETEERERKRFAEELHDGLGPLLSGIKMYLQKAEASGLLDNKDKKVINYCTELANEAIGQTRVIANNLMPNVLSDFGLIKALISFVNKINDLEKIHISITSNDNVFELQPVENLIIYRVITELINNALKHSVADTITIDFKWFNNVLRVIYFENGETFDPHAIIQNSENKGMGLKNILNRLKTINGAIEFNKGNKEGFMVKIIFASASEKVKGAVAIKK